MVKTSTVRQRVLMAALLVLAGATDQFSKWWFFKHWDRFFTFIPDWLSFEFTRNYGLAFGLSGNRWVIVLTSVALLAFLGFFAHTEMKNHKLWVVFAALLMGLGAISNLMDRVTYGFVIDWIDFRHWTVFNLADTWITVGALLIAILYWKQDYGKKVSKTH